MLYKPDVDKNSPRLSGSLKIVLASVWEDFLMNGYRFLELDGYVFPVTLTICNLKRVALKFKGVVRDYALTG